jgi:hypothetical protein
MALDATTESTFYQAMTSINSLYNQLNQVHAEIDKKQIVVSDLKAKLELLLADKQLYLGTVFAAKEKIINLIDGQLSQYVFARSDYVKPCQKILAANNKLSDNNNFGKMRVELSRLFAEKYNEYVANVRDKNTRLKEQNTTLMRHVLQEIKRVLLQYLHKVLKEDYARHDVKAFTRYAVKIRQQVLLHDDVTSQQDKVKDLLVVEFPAVKYFSVKDTKALCKAVTMFIREQSAIDAAKETFASGYPRATASMYAQEVSDILLCGMQQSTDQADVYEAVKSKVNAWYLNTNQRKQVKAVLKVYALAPMAMSIETLLEDVKKAVYKQSSRSRFYKVFAPGILTIQSSMLDELPTDVRVDEGPVSQSDYSFAHYAEKIAENPLVQFSADDQAYMQSQILRLEGLLNISHNDLDAKLMADVISYVDGNLQVNAQRHQGTPDRISFIHNKKIRVDRCTNGDELVEEVRSLVTMRGQFKSQATSSIYNTLPATIKDFRFSGGNLDFNFSGLEKTLQQKEIALSNEQQKLKEAQAQITQLSASEDKLKALLVRQVHVALGCYIRETKRARSGCFGALFSRHGASGRLSAESLARQLYSANTFDDAITQLVSYFQNNPRMRNLSFATFLLRELWTDNGLLSELSMASDDVKKADGLVDVTQRLERNYTEGRLSTAAQSAKIDGLLDSYINDKTRGYDVDRASSLVAKCQKKPKKESGALVQDSGAISNWLGFFDAAQKERSTYARKTASLLSSLANFTH